MERVFGIGKRMVADDRYRMTDETMEATMMLILVEEGADPARQ